MKKGGSVFGKKFLFLLIAGLLFASFFAVLNAQLVSANVCDDLSASNTWDWLGDKCALWLGGAEAADFTALGEMLKWLILIVVILMVYSALTSVQFPQSSIIRIVLSIIIGFLATFLITTEELITLMQGYTVMGVALAVFLPFFILGAFTILTARTLSPVGIYLQRVLWIIFSVYMVLKTAQLWWVLKYPDETFLGMEISPVTQTIAENADPNMLIVLAIASIASVIIMLGNNIILRWFAKEEIEGEVLAQKSLLKRSQELRKAEAEAMKGSV